MQHRSDLLRSALAKALDGRRCVSGWLGYGQVLFLGFGDDILPPCYPDDCRTRPPYEVVTNWSNWSLRHGESLIDADSERATAEAAVERLIGREVTHWELTQNIGLMVEFDDDSELTIERFSPEEAFCRDAWSLRLAEESIVAVSIDGQIASVPSTRPINEWFLRGTE